MKVLLIGANGMLGPHVVKALEDVHQLRLTDIKDAPETAHEYVQLGCGESRCCYNSG